MNKPKRISFTANFDVIEDYNPQFFRTRIKVFAFGRNRNMSNITKEAFEKAKYSLALIPVVAKFTELDDKYGNPGDLEGHNTYLDKDEDGNWIIKQDTYAIGTVSPDANITFEEVNEGTEEEPDIKTYVVVDNVFLWKRYEAVQKIQEWLDNGIDPKVSMEIDDIEGNYSKPDKCYTINDFTFSAICALGSEVEPCFPMAQIEQYQQQTFEDAFYEMVKELKFSLQQSPPKEVDIQVPKEGGNILKKSELIAQHFSLSQEQLEDAIRRELAEIESIELWEGFSYPRFCLVDYYVPENIVVAYDCQDGRLVGGNFQVLGDNVEIGTDTLKPYKVTYEPMEISATDDPDNDGDDSVFNLTPTIVAEHKMMQKEKEFEQRLASEIDSKNTEFESKLNESHVELGKVQTELTELQSKFTVLETEATELKEFKQSKLNAEREEAENELFERFSAQLSEDDMVDLKSKSAEMSLDVIETSLFALVGKKMARFSLNENKQNKPLRIPLPEDKPKDNLPVWADLIQ